MAINGLVVMTPTSIAYSGTSASINADGSVSFSAVTNLELRGVFSADYDNYMIVIRLLSSGVTGISGRYMSGTSVASATNYTLQQLIVNSSIVDGFRATSQSTFNLAVTDSTNMNGYTCHLFGPYLAQPTAGRAVGCRSSSGALIFDEASTHSLSTSYDGLNAFPSSGNMTGLLTVFGFAQ